MFWLAQTFIAELVQKDVRMLNERLVNIFDEGELRREATIRELRTIRAEQRLLAGVCRRARSPAAEAIAMTTKKPTKVSPSVRRSAALASDEDRFAEGLALIEAARNRAYQAVNTELVGLFEAYRGQKKVSPLVTQSPWTHHLIILSQAKPPETREFYLLAAIKGRWTKRELERQIQSAAILRSDPAEKKVSPALAQIHSTAIDELKNALVEQSGHGRGSSWSRRRGGE